MPDLPEEFVNALKKSISGEVKIDPVTKILYSTDASNYQIEPMGVVFPRSTDELDVIVELAASYQIPLLPRGSGSSLGGQAVGAALVIDCSRYLDHIIEINPTEKYAILEPGVVLNTLNHKLAGYYLQFGPDPASAERASLGGCIGNNAAGAHSITYGMTADNIHSLDVLFADGSGATLEEVPLAEAGRTAAGSGTKSAVYKAALEIREKYVAAIQANYPETWRRTSGYNLNYLLPWSASLPPQWNTETLPYPPVHPESVNLAPVLAGSEGTLAVIKRAKLRLVDLPKYTILGILSYTSIAQACDQVPALLRDRPSAIELIPQSLIRLARSVPAYAHQVDFVPGDPAAILVVEFSGESADEQRRRVLAIAGSSGDGSEVIIAETREQQQRVWGVRKVGLGILMSRPGDTKPIPFIEDTSVPVERLGEYVRGIERILASHHTKADYYAHVSAGAMHIRPQLNLKTQQGVADMRAIAEEAVELTLRMGGAVSAEHGDGLVRSEWLERAYGKEVVQAFSALKIAADPHNLLNPGKIVNAPRMDESLRYAEGYHIAGWVPVLDFAREAGELGEAGLGRAIEQCNGAGVCRKSEGVMCPSFQATRDEMHSTRGRANLLRSMISGSFIDQTSAESAVKEALDLCLACKGCKAECPSAVDMAKLKYEFVNHYYHNGHSRPWRDYLFGYIGSFAYAGHWFGPLANAVLGVKTIRRLAEGVFGLDAQRQFPRLSFRSLTQLARRSATSNRNYDVLVLNDAFTEYFQPGIGLDALKVLQASGFRPRLIPVTGAGRTLLSKGFLQAAQKQAVRLVNAIQVLDPLGKLPVVGIEPSEILTLRDEFPELMPGLDVVTKIAGRAYMIDEFLIRPDGIGGDRFSRLSSKLRSPQGSVLLHGHCYQKAQPPAEDGYPSGVQATVKMLQLAGYPVEVVDAGCCGMAGAFGYESEHAQLSLKVGELRLFPAVRAAADYIIAAAGVSCQGQIQDGTGRKAEHPISLIARLL